jgi:hypothetical protein
MFCLLKDISSASPNTSTSKFPSSEIPVFENDAEDLGIPGDTITLYDPGHQSIMDGASLQ